jgi:hypothetical protein
VARSQEGTPLKYLGSRSNNSRICIRRVILYLQDSSIMFSRGVDIDKANLNITFS